MHLPYLEQLYQQMELSLAQRRRARADQGRESMLEMPMVDMMLPAQDIEPGGGVHAPWCGQEGPLDALLLQTTPLEEKQQGIRPYLGHRRLVR